MALAADTLQSAPLEVVPPPVPSDAADRSAPKKRRGPELSPEAKAKRDAKARRTRALRSAEKAESEADALEILRKAGLGAEAGPSANTPAVVPEKVETPKRMPTAEEIANMRAPLRATFEILDKGLRAAAGPKFGLTPSDVEQLANAWAPVMAQYLPDAVSSPLGLAVITTAGVFLPKLMDATNGEAAAPSTDEGR
jgi:hypothetical protein